MMYDGNKKLDCYFPPILGNGEIAFAPDCEGMLDYTFEQFEKEGLEAFDGIVVRCGRRSNNNARVGTSRLFSFGQFSFHEGSELKRWTQDLKVENGCIESVCAYQDGAEITSHYFIHPKLNIYALNKTFNNIGEHKKVSYDVIIEGYNDALKELTHVLYTNVDDGQARIGFQMYGMDVYTGEVRLFVDKEYKAIPISNGFRIEFDVAEGESVTFFYYLEDNLEVEDYKKVLDELKIKIDNNGFSGLAEECREEYKKFYDLGYVKTADEKLNDIYKTALYNLKCYTTKYSVPVGLNNGSWDGRYFAFDEYYSFYALLGANRKELAKRVPTFRLEVCLETAIGYATPNHLKTEYNEIAKFLWETGEKGEVELSPVGFWLDHVFHMPVIGIGAFEYYEYTHDMEFLKRCYRMIRACARFFTEYMLYRDGESCYIGRCTDLERLGFGVLNPFMTSCGAIKLLECCAKASEILDIDEEYRTKCETIALELRKTLPVENGMYVPYLNCDQKSVAVYAGKFPFNVIDNDDAKLLKAWIDFEDNGSKYGNMYAMGNKLSPWYACWKAEGYTRMHMAEKAYTALKQSYESVGAFCEMFEINETKVRKRPWFTTASAVFISTVNEMLIQSEKNRVDILPAFPIEKEDISFKLAVKGGAVAEVKIEKGTLVFVLIMKEQKDVTKEYEIFFRGKKYA